MKLFQALGLDIKILIAQFINFAVLVFVLYKFGYKPIFNFLEERKNKIEQGINDAKKAAEKLEFIEQKEKEIIIQAKKEAKNILEQVKEQANKKYKTIIEQAKEDIGQMINQAKVNIQAKKAEALKEIKKEIGSLVIQALEKILEEKIDEKKDQEIIKKTIQKLCKK